MNQLTTIAALPMGGGVAAALKPEVGEAKPQLAVTWNSHGSEGFAIVGRRQLASLGYTVNAQGIIERVKA